MSRLFKSLAVALALIIGLAPAIAEARAGNSRSSGSMGSRTYNYNGGQSVQRSITPQTPRFNSPTPGMNVPRAAPSPGFGGAAAGGSFFQRHPILTGIGAGFIGYGLGSMLFGNRGTSSATAAPATDGSAAAAPAAPSKGAMLFGMLLQILLIAGVVYLIYRVVKWLMMRNMQQRGYAVAGPAPSPNQVSYDANNYGGPWGGNNGGGFGNNGGGGFGNNGGGGYGNGGFANGGYAPEPITRDIRVGEQDEQAFGELLINVQKAWSDGNMNRMRMMLTPEMVDYFSDELASNTSRGIINKVEDVRLVSGRVESAWAEEDREYATARIKFAARDYNVRLTADGREELVSGKPDRETTVEELWTFVRASGGKWLLSAIQQV